MNSPSSTAADGNTPRSHLRELWAFLNRDIRTIKGWWQNNPAPESQGPPPACETPTEPKPDITSEANPRQIEELRFRREVLDWRDDFHFNVTKTAFEAKRALAEQVERELTNMNFLRLRIFTKPARDVLELHIKSCAQFPMRSTQLTEQATLRQRLQAWWPTPEESVHILVMWPKLEWDTRLSLKLTPATRDEVLTVLDDLILGENGLADRHRQWATQFSEQILERRHVRSVSI